MLAWVGWCLVSRGWGSVGGGGSGSGVRSMGSSPRRRKEMMWAVRDSFVVKALEVSHLMMTVKDGLPRPSRRMASTPLQPGMESAMALIVAWDRERE